MSAIKSFPELRIFTTSLKNGVSKLASLNFVDQINKSSHVKEQVKISDTAKL